MVKCAKLIIYCMQFSVNTIQMKRITPDDLTQTNLKKERYTCSNKDKRSGQCTQQWMDNIHSARYKMGEGWWRMGNAGLRRPPPSPLQFLTTQVVSDVTTIDINCNENLADFQNFAVIRRREREQK